MILLVGFALVGKFINICSSASSEVDFAHPTTTVGRHCYADNIL